MLIVSPFAAGLVLGLATAGHAQTVHEFSAASSVRVETIEDSKIVEGNIVRMRARNARLVPYVMYDGEKHLARLATITTDVRTATDLEGVDPESTVTFTVDDLSGNEPRRLSSFTDPGSTGEIVGERYSAVTMPGCCDNPNLHRVRRLDTGRFLFRSTGEGVTGTSAWAEVPNAEPRTVRWAAFDGDVLEEGKKNLLGRIVYGNDQGPLSSVELRTKSQDEYLEDKLGSASGLSGVSLVWIDPKSSDITPGSGEPDNPQTIWAIEGITEPQRLGGFQLALVLDGRRLLTIPITGDRLDAAKTRTTSGITVTTAPVNQLQEQSETQQEPQAEPRWGPPAMTSVWLFEDSQSRLLTDNELAGLDCYKLWIARNEIYARNGYIFSTPKGKAYVATLGEAYHGTEANPARVLSRMNNIERQNIERIKYFERRRSCP